MQGDKHEQDKSKHARPEAYPKPTETDSQLQNQPEYIDQEPNIIEKEISNIPETKTDGGRLRSS